MKNTEILYGVRDTSDSSPSAFEVKEDREARPSTDGTKPALFSDLETAERVCREYRGMSVYQVE